MPKYAVKLGEVQLVSDKPITDEQRKRMKEELKRLDDTLLCDGNMEVMIVVS